MSEHKMTSHEEGVRTARQLLDDADEDDIESLVLGIEYEDEYRDLTITTNTHQPASETFFDMLAEQIVYLAEKHDSHPAGIIKHLTHVVQERDDTPEVDGR